MYLVTSTKSDIQSNYTLGRSFASSYTVNSVFVCKIQFVSSELRCLMLPTTAQIHM